VSFVRTVYRVIGLTATMILTAYEAVTVVMVALDLETFPCIGCRPEALSAHRLEC
jgi:hypothetical protein